MTITLAEANKQFKEQLKVCASVLISNKEGLYLAELLNKEIPGGVWVPPGGKLQIGETLRDCAIRETMEELGIQVQITGLFGISEKPYGDGIWTFLYYTGRIVSGEPKIMEPGKILELRYINLEKFSNAENIKKLS